MWTHHSGIAAAALVTCSAVYPVQAGKSRLPCIVGLGAGLPCWWLSAGCWFWMEIRAVCRATCLLCSTPEQHFRRPIFRCRRSAYMEWAAVQSAWHWAITDYFQWTSEDLRLLYRVLRPQRICDICDFFAPHINVLTYLLTSKSDRRPTGLPRLWSTVADYAASACITGVNWLNMSTPSFFLRATAYML